MSLQIIPLLISPWPRHTQKFQKMEADFSSLNTAGTSIQHQRILKLGVGYLEINLERYLGTHLCRDESLIKNLSVITLNLSDKREKYPIIVLLVWIFCVVFFGWLDFWLVGWLALGFFVVALLGISFVLRFFVCFGFLFVCLFWFGFCGFFKLYYVLVCCFFPAGYWIILSFGHK